MINLLLDQAIDVRYQKNPDGSDGMLIYSSRVDIGGLVGELNDLFFSYEEIHYEFFEIDLVGWRKYKSGAFTYYIEFQRMKYAKQKKKEMSKTS